jgi:hypothetical protein
MNSDLPYKNQAGVERTGAEVFVAVGDLLSLFHVFSSTFKNLDVVNLPIQAPGSNRETANVVPEWAQDPQLRSSASSGSSLAHRRYDGCRCSSDRAAAAPAQPHRHSGRRGGELGC